MAQEEEKGELPKDASKEPLILTALTGSSSALQPGSSSLVSMPAAPAAIAGGRKSTPSVWKDMYMEKDFVLNRFWEERGKEPTEPGEEEIGGAWYSDPRDVYKELAKPEAEKSTFLGISYQISSLYGVDTVTENFRVVLDLSVWYKIPDSDEPTYQEWKDEGTIDFQAVADDPRLTVKPPIFEIRNAVDEPEFDSCRVNFIAKFWDHNHKDEDGNPKPRWAWYVTLYAQVRCTCQEEFEMFRFPFTRNSLQVQLQLKHKATKMMYVPFNSRIAMPHWQWRVKPNDPEEKGKLQLFDVRGNCYKAARLPGNWKFENHHAAIVPFSHLTTMSSGDQYSMCLITVMLKQEPNFYLYNVCLIIVALPVLAGLAIFEDRGNMWDRLSIVITLLITISAYKVSLTAWVPQKDYLTLLDWYVVIGISIMLIMGVLLAFMKLGEDSGMESKSLDAIEYTVVVLLELFWIGIHILVWIFQSYLYEKWVDLFEAEAKRMKDIGEYTTLQTKQMKQVTFCCQSERPEPPERDNQDVVQGVPHIDKFDVKTYGIAEDTERDEDIVGNKDEFALKSLSFRVRNPKVSLEFYCNQLGFALVSYQDFLLAHGAYSNYDLVPRGALSGRDIELMQDDVVYRNEFAMRTPGGISLIWEHGAENAKDRIYNTGNRDSAGTRSSKPVKGGYHGIALHVNNVKQMVRELEKMQVKVVKHPDSIPSSQTEESQLAPFAAAQILDPDEYLITLIPRDRPGGTQF